MARCIFDGPSQNFVQEKEHTLSTCHVILSGLGLYFWEFIGCVLSPDTSSTATRWMKALHEGALPPPCIVRKEDRKSVV